MNNSTASNSMTIELLGAGSNGLPPAPWWECLNGIISECTTVRTGEFGKLIINQSGLQNLISAEARKRFKEDVLPMLMTFADIDSQLTGHIEVHLAEGILRKAFFCFQCEEGHTISPIF